MSTSLDGRTALVTGAGRGIGRAIALELARGGVSVALVARSRPELAETGERIRELGGTALAVPADLDDPAGPDDLLHRVRDGLGPVDVLVNNAGTVSPLGPSVTVDPGEWAAAIGLNLTAAVTLTFALLPAMLERGWGRVVNVSSGVATHPEAMIGANAYVTGKAALEAHTVNLAVELAGSGVTVNAYRPGRVDTAMQAYIRDRDPTEIGTSLHDRFRRFHEEGGLITPERSARSLLDRLPGDATGEIWSVEE